MKTPIRMLSICFAMSLVFSFRAQSQAGQVTADSVRQQFLHAWNAYKEYAWGHDALKPLSKKPHDWYKKSLLMTPVDAFDTMMLMGLKEEAAEAKEVILARLSFNEDMEIQTFEITIRLLGGLLSAFQIDGDKRFLSLAEDLGNRLLPEYNSATGMPYRFVNLKTGAVRDSLNNPAEIGTSLIEFGTLSKLTGNPVFYEKSKRALVELFNRRSKIGLVGSTINVETGSWVDKTSHIGGGIDSYYEYLLKSWLLFGDQDCKNMWDESIKAINTYVADTSKGGLWYGQVDMDTGKRTGTHFGALEAFFPAVLCLAGDVPGAVRLENSCFNMWNLEGIEPEAIDYATMRVVSGYYVLRPEIIESAYYLRHYTGDPTYKKMGDVFYADLMKNCRTTAGFAALRNVKTKQKMDQMESFFLAETMKYLYLLEASPDVFQFDDVIFNTEAHPIRRTWAKN